MVLASIAIQVPPWSINHFSEIADAAPIDTGTDKINLPIVWQVIFRKGMRGAIHKRIHYRQP